MATQLAADGIGFVSSWSAGRPGRPPSDADVSQCTTPARPACSSDFRSGSRLHRSRWYDDAPTSVIRADGLRARDAAAYAVRDGRRLQSVPVRTRRRGRVASRPPGPRRAPRTTWSAIAAAARMAYRRWNAGSSDVMGSTGPPTADSSKSYSPRSIVSGCRRRLRQHPLRLANRRDRSTSTSPGPTCASRSNQVIPGGTAVTFDNGSIRTAIERCSELGWLVVRFDETMLRDLDEAARQIRRIHVRRSADLRNVLDPTR